MTGMIRTIFFTTVLLFATAAFANNAETIYSGDVRQVSFYPAPATGGGLYRIDESPQLIAVVKNCTEAPLNCEVEITVKDPDGKILCRKSFSKDSLAPKATSTFRWTLPPIKEPGYYLAEASIRGGGKLCAANQSAFAVIDPVGRRDPFFSLNYNGLPSELLPAYKTLGIGTLQFTSWFWYWNKDKTPETMKKYLDGKNQSAKAFLDASGDFHLVGTIGTQYFEPGFRPNKEIENRVKQNLFPLDDSHLKMAETFSEELARRYRDKVKLWMLSEEIDGSMDLPHPPGGTVTNTMAAYVMLCRRLRDGIMKGNPSAKVGLYTIWGADWKHSEVPFMYGKVMLRDLVGKFDYLAPDAYSGNHRASTGPFTRPEDGLSNYLNGAAELSHSFGGPSLAINSERGFAVDYYAALNDKTNLDAADFTARSLIVAKASSCPMYSIFVASSSYRAWLFRDVGTSKMKKVDDYGLWRPVLDENGKAAFVPRPSVLAVAVAARQLAFAHNPEEHRIGNSVYVYFFDRLDNGSLAVVYSVEEPTDMVVNLPENTLLTDGSGRRKMLKEGKNTLKLTGTPQYLHIPVPREKLRKIFDAATLPNMDAVRGAGRKCGRDRMNILLNNPSQKELAGTLMFPGAAKPVKVTLPPFQVSSFMFKVREGTGKDAILRLDNGIERKIPLDFEGYPVYWVSKRPVFDGSGSWMKGLSPINLKAPDDVCPKSALAAELGLLKLDGSDTSAKIYFGWDSQNFYVGAVVTDKTHLQRYSGTAMWRDDCFQFVISPRFNTVPGSVRKSSPLNSIGELDFLAGLALTQQGKECYRWHKWKGGLQKIPFNVTRKGDLTIYEAAVPWEMLRISPEEGNGLRFAAVIFDNNRISDSNAKYWLAFGRGIAGGIQDASGFKTLYLEKEKQ